MKFQGANATKEMIFNIHSRLAMMLFDVECLAKRLNKEITVTSIVRPRSGDSGIHELGRAADLSVNGFSLAEIQNIVDYVNARYTFDPARPKMMSALVNDGGVYAGQKAAPHIHLQVGNWY